MTKKIAINGFGRIGRLMLRAWLEKIDNNHSSCAQPCEIVCLNGRTDIKTAVHLLRYDSVHGTYQGELEIKSDMIIAGDKKIKWLNIENPADYNWQAENIDIVAECTGKLNSRSLAAAHLKAGAKKILFSAPVSQADITVVFGVNHHLITAEHVMISNASCTTNCMAPMVKLLHENCGIKSGFMTTIHSYTTDQRIVDGSHNDLRRARSANLSMIPTSTGATKNVELVFAPVKNRLLGTSIRVPTANVSMIDFTFVAEQKIKPKDINAIFKKAAEDNPTIIGYSDEPLVSIDFNHTICSCIYDALLTHVMPENLVRIAAWYDNEWAYAHRMLDVAACIDV